MRTHPRTRIRLAIHPVRGTTMLTCSLVLTGGLALALLAPAHPASAAPAPFRDPFVGFVLDQGRIERIDLPGNGNFTVLDGINNRGEITGKYPDADKPGYHGLLLDRYRKPTRIDYPGAAATYANKSNDRGSIVGAANPSAPTIGTPGTVGYVLQHGKFTQIRVPGAVETQAFGINNRGQVVGEYQDQGGVYHGYRWQNGQFTTFDGPDGTGASITDVNDRGDMVGVYAPAAGAVRGFVFHDGRYTTFAAGGLPLTFPFDINNRGQIAGTTGNADLTEAHGFLLATGAGGPVTPIDIPGAPNTTAYGLDDHGRIVGIYDNPDPTPSAQQMPAGARPMGLGQTMKTQ